MNSQSVDRALDVIELCARSGRDLGIREIARELDISPAIIQRLVNTLAARSYLQQNDETRRYRLGFRALSLGSDQDRSDDLLSLANRELSQLADEHALNGFVGALRNRAAIYLLAVQGRGPIGIRVNVGEAMPLHSTAIGKVLLAALPVEEARRLIGAKSLPRLTERTVTDPKKLIASLARVRRTEVAIVREENLPGVLSVGAPVRNANGSVIAAVSVAFPKSLETSKSPEAVAPLLVRVAERLSRSQGWQESTVQSVRDAAE